MITITVSPKFQVVIPKNVRESMGIIAGQKVQMLTYCNRIELIPIKPMSEMKGILNLEKSVERYISPKPLKIKRSTDFSRLMGIDTKVPKDKDRI